MIWRIATFTGVGLMGGVLGLWLADRTPPTEFIKVELLTPTVPPGGELRIAYEVFRQRSCRTKYQRVYRDGSNPPTRFVLPDVDIWASPAPPGTDRYTTAVPISAKAVQGSAEYRPITQYICNPLHYWWPIVQLPGNVQFEIAGDPVIEQIEAIPR